MRPTCRLVAAVVAVAVASMVAAGGAVAASGQLINLNYDVHDLPADTTLSVVYNTGVLDGSGGSAHADTGSINTFILANNALNLTASDDGLQQGEADQWVTVASAPITGVAHVPAGTSVSVTNGDTGQTIALSNGAFSIPTGVKQLGATPSTKQTVRCRGNEQSCQARVNIARGASNRTIVIDLTRPDLKLSSVTANPSRSKGAYSITRGHFTLAGSEYVMTLNAARANPPGAHLTLRFATAS